MTDQFISDAVSPPESFVFQVYFSHRDTGGHWYSKKLQILGGIAQMLVFFV